MLSIWKLSRYLMLGVFVSGMSFIASAGEQLEFNGFLTQGYFLTDHNRFNGNSESGSFDFRELGVNASWKPSSEMLLTGQVVSRKAGKVDDGDLALDYARLDYRMIESDMGSLGVSVGRIKNPFGFYNATRDVAFTRPSIVLPQSLYFDKARTLELSSDGFMLYGNRFFETGVLEAELVIGKPRVDTNVEFAYLNRDWPGEFDDSRGFLLRTEYSLNDYSLIGGVTYGGFRLDFDAPGLSLPGAPGDGTIKIDVLVLSMQYNLQKWSFTGEYFKQDIDWGELGGVYLLLPEVTSESFYLQVEHRVSPTVSLFLRRDILYQDKNDRDGLTANTLFGRPPHTQYAFDWTFGIGWQPDPNWLLRAEVHNLEGTGWLSVQDNPDDSERKENWNMLSLQATYRF